jgi:NADH:ubiquinone reductase (H+-translocating)
MSSLPSASARPRIVIVGAGFGGLSAAKALARAAYDVSIVDQHNYHLFQPLLYQVATAALSPADIASPIRSILSRQKNTTVILAEVSGVDLDRRQIVAENRRIDYDFLILSTGARHAYFGHDDWASYAPGIKQICSLSRRRSRRPIRSVAWRCSISSSSGAVRLASKWLARSRSSRARP